MEKRKVYEAGLSRQCSYDTGTPGSRSEKYGNPSGVYQMSSENRGMIENVREQIAKTLNASAEEIYFTSGGTESDNWAIKAAAQMLKEKGRHIITSKIEHHAILNSCAYLENRDLK